MYILFFRLETSANVQTTEIVYAADDTQTTDTRSIGVSLIIKNIFYQKFKFNLFILNK